MARSDDEKKLYLNVTTPLDAAWKKFYLKSVEGEEQISAPFHYRLRLITDDGEAVDFKKIIGKKATVTIEQYNGVKRYINGVVTHFVQGGSHEKITTYHAELRPWLWQLTLTTNNKIFQNMTVTDIISSVFSDFGFTDFKLGTKKSYKQRVYTVQYNETAFNFVSRLMEEEGIFYFFEHTESVHTLVLADDADAHEPCPGLEKARLKHLVPEHRANDDIINRCFLEEQLVPNKFAARDYNFETPQTKVHSDVDAKEPGKFRVYEYPGGFDNTGDGETVVDKRIDSLELPGKLLRGEGFCRAFIAGYQFDFVDHDRPDINGKYVLLKLETKATPEQYYNRFTSFPLDAPFKPPRVTKKPAIVGTQTAVVTGKKGEEIWTDKYGRIKVQFHWDELGKFDENSSCWIRVTQMWAGKNWGTLYIPRIGAEVIVSFLEGDPDRPIVTGTVYNASQVVPYSLPGEKTKSTVKTDSSIGGGGSNEIRFEDKKGSEELYTHAQKDQNEIVENNMSTTVKANQTVSVIKNQSISVGGNRSKSVTGNQTVNVDGTHTETIKKNTSITITEGAYSHDIAKGSATSHVKGEVKEEYDAGQNTSVAKDIIIESKETKIHITAATEIKLEVGGSKLLMKSDGSIELKGSNIAINGGESVTTHGGSVTSEADSNHDTKGAIVVSDGSATNTVKGGMVMLNP